MNPYNTDLFGNLYIVNFTSSKRCLMPIKPKDYITFDYGISYFVEENCKKGTNKMDNNKFEELCKKVVSAYTNEHMDKTDGTSITQDDVYIVWQCKTLQNSKALVSTNVTDGMYYELTYNGDKHELYLDAYKKFNNKVISIK